LARRAELAATAADVSAISSSSTVTIVPRLAVGGRPPADGTGPASGPSLRWFDA
jgi:hypothetical protein